eukprot:7695898-Lingulodinium_polyedra.AAC.1
MPRLSVATQTVLNTRAPPRVCVAARGANDRGIVYNEYCCTQCRGYPRHASRCKRVAKQTVHNTRAPFCWRAHA